MFKGKILSLSIIAAFHTIAVSSLANAEISSGNWGFENNGTLANSVADVDINLNQARDIIQNADTPNEVYVIGIIDTGISAAQTKLTSQLFVNPAPTQGDIHGMDYVAATPTGVGPGQLKDYSDSNNGTALAGLVAEALQGTNIKIATCTIGHTVDLAPFAGAALPAPLNASMFPLLKDVSSPNDMAACINYFTDLNNANNGVKVLATVTSMGSSGRIPQGRWAGNIFESLATTNPLVKPLLAGALNNLTQSFCTKFPTLVTSGVNCTADPVAAIAAVKTALAQVDLNHVVSAIQGGAYYYPKGHAALSDALSAQEDAGILYISGAGDNGRQENLVVDTCPGQEDATDPNLCSSGGIRFIQPELHYPGALKMSHMINVTAADPAGKLGTNITSSSTYGHVSNWGSAVDVAAPGYAISVLTGVSPSMTFAHYNAVLAYLNAHPELLSADYVKSIIKSLKAISKSNETIAQYINGQGPLQLAFSMQEVITLAGNAMTPAQTTGTTLEFVKMVLSSDYAAQAQDYKLYNGNGAAAAFTAATAAMIKLDNQDKSAAEIKALLLSSGINLPAASTQSVATGKMLRAADVDVNGSNRGALTCNNTTFQKTVEPTSTATQFIAAGGTVSLAAIGLNCGETANVVVSAKNRTTDLTLPNIALTPSGDVGEVNLAWAPPVIDSNYQLTWQNSYGGDTTVNVAYGNPVPRLNAQQTNIFGFIKYIVLNWTDAAYGTPGKAVNVFQNGSIIYTGTASQYNNLRQTGGKYKICWAGTSTCSNTIVGL